MLDEEAALATIELLSPVALQALAEEKAEVVAYVVATAHNMLTYWEEADIVLDPVQREAVLNSVVVTQISTGRVLFESGGIGALSSVEQDCGSPDQGVEVGPGVHGTKGLLRAAAARLRRNR